MPIEMTKRKLEQQIKRQLAVHCLMYFKGDLKLGMAYFEKKGYPISDTYYYDLLEYARSDEAVQDWITEQGRIGFVNAHIQLIEDATELRDRIKELLEKELSKPDLVDVVYQTKNGPKEYKDQPNPDKSKMYIIALNRLLVDINKRLEDLNMSNPTLANVRNEIQQLEKRAQEAEAKAITQTN